MGAAPLTLDTLRQGGKRAMAQALALIEERPQAPETIALLDAALAAAQAHVIGLTGPPGVGKSTLTGALVKAARARGETVGVVAVDPSSRRSGGALLGDRARIPTDPDDRGVFIRSLAARERLGGLSDIAFAAIVLMRAIFQRVIVETVGVGQSEGDIALISDTTLLAVQPGSGDGLQFMKAGIMELPDVVVVTKADLGALATRAKAEVQAALGLTAHSAAVVLVSATTGEGLDALELAVSAHHNSIAPADWPRRRALQMKSFQSEAIRDRFGREGLRHSRPLPLTFAALAEEMERLQARWR